VINKNIFILLTASLVLSFAPLFAKFIDLGAGMITWWRCLFACVVLGGFLAWKKQIRLPANYVLWMAITGALLGIHWWLFFLSIQKSSVSIGVLMLFTFPLLSALIEPLTRRTPVSIRQILGGAGIVVGVYFLVPDFSLGNSTTAGVLIGLLGALLYAIRNIITKNHLSAIGTMTTLFYQLLFAFLALCIALSLSFEPFVVPDTKQLGQIVILAIVFTIGGHGLMTYCLKLFSASTVGIVSSLQVAFSTVLAFIFLSEVPTHQFYYGAMIIVSIAVYELLPRNQQGEKENRN
jgi:drug/metabolite transporter (DMT)-like permease